MPETVFDAPAEIQAAFLRGLFGADGCVARRESEIKALSLCRPGQPQRGAAKGRAAAAHGVRRSLAGVSTASAESGEAPLSPTPVKTAPRSSTTHARASTCGSLAPTLSASRRDRLLDAAQGGRAWRRCFPRPVATAPRQRCQASSRARTTARRQVYNLTEPLHHSYLVDGFVVANCSEYMHVDDSACNLASLNLMKFRRDDGRFDVEAFEHAVDIVFLAQEIIVGFSSYPTEEITANANAFRQLGLGYANLGALLMSNGLPYDSDAGRNVAAAITALMTGRAYRQSAQIAAGGRDLRAYAKNREPHNGVMRMHRDASYDDRPDRDQGRPAGGGAARLGRGGRARRAARLPQRAGDGAGPDRHDQLPDGLRHDRDRARLLAGQVQGAGRRRADDDRQPLGPAGAGELGYSEAEIDQIEAHINENGTIVGAPGSRTSTCRCSTSPSASGRSPTPATST